MYFLEYPWSVSIPGYAPQPQGDRNQRCSSSWWRCGLVLKLESSRGFEEWVDPPAGCSPYLEDRAPGLGGPWLITMIFLSPPTRVMGPFPNGHSWLINGGDPNHLLSGGDHPSRMFRIFLLSHQLGDMIWLVCFTWVEAILWSPKI